MSHSGATSNKLSIKKYSLYKTVENVCTLPYSFREFRERQHWLLFCVSTDAYLAFTLLLAHLS